MVGSVLDQWFIVQTSLKKYTDSSMAIANSKRAHSAGLTAGGQRKMADKGENDRKREGRMGKAQAISVWLSALVIHEDFSSRAPKRFQSAFCISHPPTALLCRIDRKSLPGHSHPGHRIARKGVDGWEHPAPSWMNANSFLTN